MPPRVPVPSFKGRPYGSGTAPAVAGVVLANNSTVTAAGGYSNVINQPVIRANRRSVWVSA